MNSQNQSSVTPAPIGAMREIFSKIERRFAPLMGSRLVFKLGLLLLILLCLKLLMIGVGFYSAGRMQGDATIINYAGSERMRSYQMAFLLNRYVLDVENQSVLKDVIKHEAGIFEKILYGLRNGDTNLSLHPPRNAEIIKEMDLLIQRWHHEVSPLMASVLSYPYSSDELISFNAIVADYVKQIDRVVTLLERESNEKVAMFDGIQYLFLLLTIAVTLLAIYWVAQVIMKPVGDILKGVRSLTGGNFQVTVEARSDDEIGELARGFNFMAKRLEEFYTGLEQKVREKTKDLEGRHRELAILYDITATLNQYSSMDDIHRNFLSRIMSLSGARAGCIRLFTPDGKGLQLVSHIGLSSLLVTREICLTNRQCMCGVVATQSSGFMYMLTGSEMISMNNCRNEGFKSLAIIHITCQGTTIGLFNLFLDVEKEFTPEEQRLMQTMGSHLGIAIENNRLHAKARQLAVMEERTSLARELHDSIAQSLAFLNIQANLLQDSLHKGHREQADRELTQIREGIQECYEDLRELLHHFRTRLEPAGLEETIRLYVKKYGQQTGIDTVLTVKDLKSALDSEAEVHVFHIVQEALTNIRKHAGASRVRVTLSEQPDLSVAIEDNGVGFDLASHPHEEGASRHIGFSIMNERAAAIGGTLEIHSKPGAGTRILLSIPKPVRSQHEACSYSPG